MSKYLISRHDEEDRPYTWRTREGWGPEEQARVFSTWWGCLLHIDKHIGWNIPSFIRPIEEDDDAS